MKMEQNTLSELASLLETERKRQKLTRAQAAAVCNVSPSFIRDAETQPERCTLGKLVQLVNGLGLSMSITSRHESERATDVLRPGFAEARATDALRLSPGVGIINSARQRSRNEQ
ncbi:MAG: helix-turn-helix domain-containing protein [Hylemonella sp.]